MATNARKISIADIRDVYNVTLASHGNKTLYAQVIISGVAPSTVYCVKRPDGEIRKYADVHDAVTTYNNIG